MTVLLVKWLATGWIPGVEISKEMLQFLSAMLCPKGHQTSYSFGCWGSFQKE
jgi:hypothetical protein